MRRGSLALMVVMFLVVPGVGTAGAPPADLELVTVRCKGQSQPTSEPPAPPKTSEAATESETVAAGDPWAMDPVVNAPYARRPAYLRSDKLDETQWKRMSPTIRAWLLGAEVTASRQALLEGFARAISPSVPPNQTLRHRYAATALEFRERALQEGPLRLRKGDAASASGTKGTTGPRDEGDEKGEKDPSATDGGHPAQRLTRQIRRATPDVKELAEAFRGLGGALEDLGEAMGVLTRLGHEPPRCSPDPRTARLQTAATCFLAVILVSRAQEGTNQGGQDRPRSRAAELATARNAARQIDALVRQNEALLARVRQIEAREARDTRLMAAERRIKELEDENRRLRSSRVGLRVAFETKNRGAARRVVIQVGKVTARRREGKPFVLARR